MELLLIYLSFLLVTIIACLIYYKTIKKAQFEYESSKEILKNITLDFSLRLQKVSKDVSRLLMGFEDIKKMSYSSSLMNEENKKTILDIIPKIEGLSNKVGEIEKEISKLKIDFEKIRKGDLQLLDNVNLDTLEANDVLINLTDTEIEVLTIICENGEASVSEIRKHINKTREHTARLLKKLYDKGYIDRNSSRMPYRYYVRKELKDEIKRRQNVKASI